MSADKKDEPVTDIKKLLEESDKVIKEADELLKGTSSLLGGIDKINSDFAERMKKVDEEFAERKAKRDAEWAAFEKDWEAKRVEREKKFEERMKKLDADSMQKINKLDEMQDKLLSGELSIEEVAKELGIDTTKFFSGKRNIENLLEGFSSKDIEEIKNKVKKLH